MESQIQNTAALNNDGIALEKAGRIPEAITAYESCVKLEYPATHAYDRLLILYRKAKDYENEIRVAELAIKIFGKENRLRASRASIRYPHLKKDIEVALSTCEGVKEGKWYIFSPYNVIKYIQRLDKAKALLGKS